MEVTLDDGFVATIWAYDDAVDLTIADELEALTFHIGSAWMIGFLREEDLYFGKANSTDGTVLRWVCAQVGSTKLAVSQRNCAKLLRQVLERAEHS